MARYMLLQSNAAPYWLSAILEGVAFIYKTKDVHRKMLAVTAIKQLAAELPNICFVSDLISAFIN